MSFIYILQAALGIGLVIFVHELGHYICARLCGVRVEVFSLGFGPKVLSWRKGPTTYQIAAVPLGGYVRMAGEEALYSDRAARPDELPSKSVGQRFLIYSGGVIANVIFGLVVFPIIFMWGVSFNEPLVGQVVPGSPAWHARLDPNSRIERVNGEPVFMFMNIPTAVALGPPDETVLELLNEDGTRSEVRLEPEYDESWGALSIGLRPSADPENHLRVAPDSPAALAGLEDGDRLVAVHSPYPDLPLRDQLFWPMLAGEAVVVDIERDGGQRTFEVQPQSSESPQSMLGVGPAVSVVGDLRANALIDALDLRIGDRLRRVGDVDVFSARSLLRALYELDETTPELALTVERGTREVVLKAPRPSGAEVTAFVQDLRLEIVPDGEIIVQPTSAAEEIGLQSGDRILTIDNMEVAAFTDLQRIVRDKADSGVMLDLRVERRTPEGPSYLDLAIEPRPYQVHDYGMQVAPARYVYKAPDPATAVIAGFQQSWKYIEEAYLTLKRMLFGQVSSENLGGIITIGVVSHSFASVGLTKLFFFLCILSMNLAFLNVLPIPLLDGGHLFFLLVEKLKGSPVSERVMGYSQMVGLVLILSLMIYVTYNDLDRLLGN